MSGYTTPNQRRTELPGEKTAILVLALARSLSTPLLISIEAAIRDEVDRRISAGAEPSYVLHPLTPATGLRR